MTQVQLVKVGENREGQRVDNFLLSQLKGVPKSWVYRVIRKGQVRINGKRCKPTQHLALGDEVRIPPVRTRQQGDVPAISEGFRSSLEQRIVYEDDVFLVLNKPHGIAVHGGSGVSLGLIEALRQARPEQHFLELVHRLDKDTSGCIMIAKKRSALTRLQDLIRHKQMQKIYRCLVYGQWPDSLTEVREPLERCLHPNGERYVRVSEDGKPSLTRYRVLQHYPGYSYLEASPVTGRTHQIRVHCQYNRCPIAGDSKYASETDLRSGRKQGLDRMYLHACSLTLPHPVSGKEMTVTAEPDSHWQAALKKL